MIIEEIISNSLNRIDINICLYICVYTDNDKQ